MKIDAEQLTDILDVTSASGLGGVCVDTARISFDSRKLKEGDIFFALSTDKQDGAKYIGAALKKGAVLAIAEKNPDNLERVILVRSSLEAFHALARHVRSLYKGVVIGITGSSGKTTSKELVAHMLASFGKTCFGEGSFNNHIGTPYNLCKLDFESSFAVFELGMDHAGEISALVDLVRPNLAVVTNIFPMHMENFKDFRDIAEAKAEIFEKVFPHERSSTAVINADAFFAEEVLIPAAKRRGIDRIITFGKAGKIKLKSFSINEKLKTGVDIEINGALYHHEDLGLGERFAYNANLAAAIAFSLGLDVTKALEAIADFSPIKGRGKISAVKISEELQITLIDDSYNGQPAAMHYALSTLDALPQGKGRKVAILGKMAEIGDASEQEHRSLGRGVAHSSIDVFIGVGAETKFILEELPQTKTTFFWETIEGAYEELTKKILQSGDIVLIKGSHNASRVFELADRLLAGN